MTLAAPSDTQRVRFIEHRGQRILYIDFSGLQSADDILREMQTAREIIRVQPHNSLRTLSNVKDARYSPPVMDAMKEFTSGNKPFVRHAAVFGMERVHRVLYRAVLLFSRRSIEIFDDLDAARDWLAKQP
ncbi:MAG TPA: STAS/SEC14 domain-containing protein [Longimicrobium sp.]